MSKPLKVAEGLWFAVPLRDGGFGVGLAARVSPSRGVKTLFCYLFPYRYSEPPSLEKLLALKPSDAISLERVSSLGIKKGTWPLIGIDPKFDREKWPMPSFVRQDLVSKNYRKTTYSPDDPSLVIWEGLCPLGEELVLPQDGLSGYGAVEIFLTNQIANIESEK
ncbi:Imm26 family immunity protein [Chitinimonas sp. BJB300]|uniref:Imm26 family immunity protein n=1 Tax=Chitinimonas sp. BJB300 TaxID=1559339 RepID=UPI000C0C5BC1|nr:Imm26 family immunity protein [Chitinimonas sp. BJB300]PHV09727.1 hypothetical protein CSQ89_20130 [Chitinimonas sp. BJB300]TSJ84910.1 hypothetical protein FG002_018285 [Chitinimonas sp. BJB300]